MQCSLHGLESWCNVEQSSSPLFSQPLTVIFWDRYWFLHCIWEKKYAVGLFSSHEILGRMRQPSPFLGASRHEAVLHSNTILRLSSSTSLPNVAQCFMISFYSQYNLWLSSCLGEKKNIFLFSAHPFSCNENVSEGHGHQIVMKKENVSGLHWLYEFSFSNGLVLPNFMSTSLNWQWFEKMYKNGVTSGWWPVSSGVAQGWILWSVLFNVFMNPLDAGINCTLSKFASDIKLGEAVDPLVGREAFQRYLD